MKWTFQAADGQPPYQLDPVELHKELAVALGGWTGWSSSVVDFSVVTVDVANPIVNTEQTIRTVIEAHVTATPAREAATATRRQGDAAAVTAAKAEPVIQYLVSHTPAECAAYVNANVTTLAQAKDMLAKFAMALSVLARRELR